MLHGASAPLTGRLGVTPAFFSSCFNLRGFHVLLCNYCLLSNIPFYIIYFQLRTSEIHLLRVPQWLCGLTHPLSGCCPADTDGTSPLFEQWCLIKTIRRKRRVTGFRGGNPLWFCCTEKLNAPRELLYSSLHSGGVSWELQFKHWSIFQRGGPFGLRHYEQNTGRKVVSAL